MNRKKKVVGSLKLELIKKSREAALAAVQIFNNPHITFKSESYIVLMIIAWTYLLHAYFRERSIDYRYFRLVRHRKRFDKTKHGAVKCWELERCLNHEKCPIDKNTVNNLRFLIELRHEIEHQMTTKLDEVLSARYQSCSLNYNHYIKELFGIDFAIESNLSFSLQFSAFSTEQKALLNEYPDLPQKLQSFIRKFDESLTDEEYNSPKFAYRILFVPKTANRKGQADRVIEFIASDSPLAANINKDYYVIKESEKNKYLPAQIVNFMKEEGYQSFSMHDHTQLWKELDGKNPNKGFGTLVAKKQWYWFDKWLDEVRKNCQKKYDKKTG